jgi:predicted MFS family arabinose efflux permease
MPSAGQQNPRLVLGLLFALNTMLILDKIVFTILLEPIKAEFALSDLHLGLLQGSVYALCFGLASLPLGLLADRLNRRNIAVCCLGAWSVMTAVCGMAQNFVAVLLARIGVGIGEAGGGPAAVSILSDVFEHRRRAMAMAVFTLGTPAAGLINLSINTQIAHHFGWRAPLFFAAALGAVVAVSMLLFLREPARGQVEQRQAGVAPPVGQTLRFILSQRSLLLILGGALVSYIVLAGVSSWHFSFLVRTYGVSLQQVGPILGACIAVAGITGFLLSGWLADYLGRADERWRTRVMAGISVISVLFGTCAFLAPSWQLALAFGALFSASASVWLAPALALCQSLVHLRMRATVGSVLFLLSNLFGYGIGPAVAGLLSDLFTLQGFNAPLRMALLCMVSINLLSVLLFSLAGRTLRHDLQRVDARTAGAGALPA